MLLVDSTMGSLTADSKDVLWNKLGFGSGACIFGSPCMDLDLRRVYSTELPYLTYLMYIHPLAPGNGQKVAHINGFSLYCILKSLGNVTSHP